MNVYRDTNASIVFEHPHPGPLTAVVYRDDESTPVYSPVSAISSEAGRFTLVLPWQATEVDGTLKIVWSAAGFERRQMVEVRTPIVPLNRLRTLFHDTNWGDAELSELENNVRLIIESYTGQRFSYEYATKTITGTGEKRMALPMRLARLEEVASSGPVGFYGVSNDGWYLYVTNKEYLTTKEMPPEDLENNVVWTGVKGVIHVPDSYWRKFRTGTQYQITGEWGYQSVPEDVQEAATLLAADFGSMENLYRDRYLEVIKSGDWNLGYSPGAYRGTGNARADQLLNKYRRQSMVII